LSHHSNSNLNNNSCLFSDEGSRVMMISDEHAGIGGTSGSGPGGLHQQPSRVTKAYSQLATSDMRPHAGLQEYNPCAGNQRGVSRDQSRGRTGDGGLHAGHNLSTTLGATGAGSETLHRQGLPIFKKNPSSPSKIFK